MRFILIVTIGLLLLSCLAWGQTSAPKPVQPAWDPSYAEVPDNPVLPRVLLIGDSISMQYTIPTRRLLAGIANVHRIPMNGSTTVVGLQNLSAWIGKGPWDVIHFNWGLHDLTVMLGQGGVRNDGSHQVSLDQYKKNLEELVSQLKQTGATLIWATTTPVPDGPVNVLYRRKRDVPEYNAVALKIMRKNGIAIDDLYSFALPRLSHIQKPINVHFTDEGADVLAQPVAASIRRALEQRKRK